MPYKKVGGGRFYSHCTPGEEAMFAQRDLKSKTGGGGAPIPARAMRPGSKYKVVSTGDQAPEDPPSSPPPEDQEGE